MIQAYEQGDQDIMKAEARTVFALERVLGYAAEVIHGWSSVRDVVQTPKGMSFQHEYVRKYGIYVYRVIHCIIKTRNYVSGCVNAALSGLYPRTCFTSSRVTK